MPPRRESMTARQRRHCGQSRHWVAGECRCRSRNRVREADVGVAGSHRLDDALRWHDRQEDARFRIVSPELGYAAGDEPEPQGGKGRNPQLAPAFGPQLVRHVLDLAKLKE